MATVGFKGLINSNDYNRSENKDAHIWV